MTLTQSQPMLMTTDEAARLLGVTRTTVCRWIEGGELPAVRVGTRGRWRVVRAHVDRLVRSESSAWTKDET